jgi:hypothetical protein
MVEVEFEQVEDEEQKQEAGGLIREYLQWLNERLRKDYRMAFEVEPWCSRTCQTLTSSTHRMGDSTSPG